MPFITDVALYAIALALSATAAAKSIAWVSPAFLLFALLERFGPVYGTRPSLAAQIKGVLFQLVGTMLGTVPVFMFWQLVPRPVPMWPGLAFPLALLIGDFFHYWEHRFEHRFLWNFHAVHHATRDLSGTSNFNHFAHALFMQLIYGVPVGLITRDPLAIPLMTATLYLQATFVHSPTKLSIGPLRRIFADNRNHRIHHAVDPRLHNKNFGPIFTFWDFLFGTMHWPSKDEWPETGIAEYGEIDGLREFLHKPFLPPPSRRAVQART